MIQWNYQEIADPIRLLKRCTNPDIPFIYEREVRMRDLWTAYIGPYYVSIWSGDLFYTVQINHRAVDTLIAVDLVDAQMKALYWVSEQTEFVMNEARNEWHRVAWENDRYPA